MKYYLIAGEASGDLHGANLMKALKERDDEARFRYLGGDQMQAEGGELVKHSSEMAFMGFVEVLANLRSILSNLKKTKSDIIQWQPDALILIDFPGFNLKIAEFAKARGLKVFYYISPKVWAWNQKRVLKIKRVVDHMFCILPFEVDFYKTWGMDVDYIGNPLLDAIDAFEADEQFADKFGQERKLVALLPGSRRQEISRMLPDMIAVADAMPQYQFVIAGAPNFDEEFYARFMTKGKYPLVFGKTYDLLHIAGGALVASGTATLETALFHVPQAVLYKGNKLTIAIARMLIKIRFISLVNLIMDKAVVRELIQEECNPAEAGRELKRLMEPGAYREEMLANYRVLSERMGEAGASARAARLILKYLKQ